MPNKFTIDRRFFLKQSALLAGSLFIPFGLTSANEAKEHFLIQFNIDGGWDTTLITESWDFSTPPDPKKIFIEYSENEILPFGNYFVPPCLLPLKKYFSRMTLFNGVMMSPLEVGHPSPELFAKTGTSDGSLPSLTAQFLESYYDIKTQGIFASSQLYTAGKYFNKIHSPEILSLLKYPLNSEPIEENYSISDLIPIQSPLEEAKLSLSSKAKALQMCYKKYQIFLDPIEDLSIKHLCLGFLSGLYPTANFTTPSGLDTHSEHPTTHKNLLLKSTEFIAKYVDTLASVPYLNSGESLLDRTTIIIHSEFTRTPRLNLTRGKDHNPFSNSMIVISP
ncbi:MAG: DUF1501 domain-containing protein, partial [Bdellovibrionaceae bacterium]|nr:DUF1501 domain-containing protein [Pseudobdellovibrionaceae bacterium]